MKRRKEGKLVTEGNNVEASMKRRKEGKLVTEGNNVEVSMKRGKNMKRDKPNERIQKMLLDSTGINRIEAVEKNIHPADLLKP